MKIIVTLTVDISRSEGPNYSKEEVQEALQDEINGMDPGFVQVSGDRGDSDYEIYSWEVTS